MGLLEGLEGFGVTFRKLFEERVTTEYPEVKRPKAERLHGRHVLNRYEDGMEKCIGCELCAGVCPAKCIYVRGADNPPMTPCHRANATATSTRSITSGAFTATSASRRARPRRSPNRNCSSSRSRIATTRSTRRTNWSSATTACHSIFRGKTGGRAKTSTRPPGCGATSPSGSAAYVGEVAWSGELGYGIRAPEKGQTADVDPVSSLDAPRPMLRTTEATTDAVPHCAADDRLRICS